MSRAVIFATLAMSNPRNAFRKASRFPNTISQLSPAWNTPRVRASNRADSSYVRVPQTLSWYRTSGESPVPAQAHRGFPSGPMMTSLIRAGGRSSLYLGVPLSTQRSRRSTFSVVHGVSHGIEPARAAARIASAFALTSSNGPEVEEVKHRRPVPLSKERFDVALEGRRAVVRTLTAFFFQLPSC